MKNNASLIYNVFLVIGDFLALVAAFVAAYILRVKLDPRPLIEPIQALPYLGIFLTVLPFWILIFALLGLYNSNIYEKRFVEFGRLFVGSFVGLLFLVFWNFISSEPIFPARLVPIYGFTIGFVLLLAIRNLLRYIRTKLFSYSIGLTRVVIVGNSAVTGEIISSLSDHRTGYKVVGVVGTKHTNSSRIPAFKNFKDFLDSNPKGLHGIIQTELFTNEARNAEILTYAQENHVGYRFVPGNSELFVGNIDVELFRSSVPVIVVRQTAIFGWGRIVKRLSDIVWGSLLLLLATPFMLIIALCVKLSDGGRVFFRQTRLTRFDRKFKVYKFRTMNATYNGLDPEEAFQKMGRPELIQIYRENGDKLPGRDPRMTVVGRLLRATSLDELPQLINVVKGDISLVGPRALIPQELASYKKRHAILSVKSGVTGLAQVSGRRNISFEERRKLDLYYVQNWSVWLDLVILVKTLRSLRGSN